MTIAHYAERHGLEEVVHFTTNKGLLGIAFTEAVVPRQQLRREEMLEFILQINAATRLDAPWFNHVSMSLNDINRRFFEVSARHWHPDLWWAILSFDPAILSDDGVTFVNTNNGWRGGVVRRQGLEGLRMIYETDVNHGGAWGSHAATGTAPTCPQAEVLYPGRLALNHLRRVYVRDQDNYREACSLLTFLGREVPVEIDRERFLPHPNDPCRP